jgi:hypothetical protein
MNTIKESAKRIADDLSLITKDKSIAKQVIQDVILHTIGSEGDITFWVLVENELKIKREQIINRSSILRNRIAKLNIIMRDRYPADFNKINRLIIQTNKKLMILERIVKYHLK